MAKILIIAEHRNGKLKKSTLELVGFSSQGGHDTRVALLGNGVSALTQELASFGAKEVHVVDNATLSAYTAEAYGEALCQLVKTVNPDLILAAHSPQGRDFMPRLSAKLEAPLVTDCTQVSIDGATVKGRRPLYAGKASAAFEFLGAGVKLLTVRPNTFAMTKAEGSRTAATVSVSVNLGELKSKCIDTIAGTLSRPDVTEATIVVSGGRSFKNAENFKILEELADSLGAAVGASRAAVDAGYRPHRDQVGQTGKVVSPLLYIACGISGAIQHLAGMRTAKVIVAINTDPEAPIFQIADYGVVGDLFAVLPLLTQEIKKIKET